MKDGLFENKKEILTLKYAFPELEELLPLRYNILNTIKYKQPVGRRMLSASMGYTERVVRRECDILKSGHLIEYYPDGMRITEKGENVLVLLRDAFYMINGTNELALELAHKLNIKQIIISSSGLDDNESSLVEIGYEAAKYLDSIITPKTIIGLTGGSSIEKVINGYRREWANKLTDNEIMVVPARGGLGTKNEYQANTLAEILANKLGASHQLLYTQDNLQKSTIEKLKNEPHIQKILTYINEIDILLFGIGKADVMASRRSLDDNEIEKIIEKGAVAESFGYYFNKNGEIVHEISTIGIDLNKFKTLKNVIAVAGGVDKAESIIAISKLNSNLVLVTNEATAIRMNELI